MSVLISLLAPARALFMALDSVAYGLLDDVYEIILNLSDMRILTDGIVSEIMGNIYVIFGVIAFFRLALVLINSLIDPEKMNEKGKGLSSILIRTVTMIILVAIVPFLFDLAYEFQGKIVTQNPRQNIVFQIVLGDETGVLGDDSATAGQVLRNSLLSTVITIDDAYLVNSGRVCTDPNDAGCGFYPLKCVDQGNGTCQNTGGYVYDETTCGTDECQEAVGMYNMMYVNEDISPSGLAGYATVSSEFGNNEIYVYNYMFLLSTVIGVFVTYVLITFGIDIAVRMFELAVLEVVSPLFIATYIDPNSSKSGPFKNWLTAVGKSYSVLFVRMALLAFIVFIILLLKTESISDLFYNFGSIGSWVKVFVIIGLLIFAKKAPSWISNMLGIKSDDGFGLNLAKRLGGMAIAGGMVTRGLDRAKGALKSGAKKAGDFGRKKTKNFTSNRLRNSAARLGAMKEQFRKNRLARKNGQKKGSLWQAGKVAAKEARINNWGKDSNGIFKSIGEGYLSGRQTVDPNALGLSDSFRRRSESALDKYKKKIGTDPKAIEKDKNAASTRRSKALKYTQSGDRDKTKSWQGTNEFKDAMLDKKTNRNYGLTEEAALIKDMMNNGAYNFENGKFEIAGKTYLNVHDAAKAWKDYQYNDAGQKEILARVAETYRDCNNRIVSAVNVKNENDEKLAQLYTQQAELMSKNVDGSLDEHVKHLGQQIEQLERDNKDIVSNVDEQIQQMAMAESTISDPKDCVGAIKVGNDYYTTIGKYIYDSDSGTYKYELNSNLGDIDKIDSNKFKIDSTKQSEISDKINKEVGDKLEKFKSAIDESKKTNS